MPRGAVGKARLLRIEGLDQVLENVLDFTDRAKAENLKEAFLEGAKPLWSQVKKNIQILPRSARAKEVLDACTIINKQERRKPFVLVGMSQQAGIKKLAQPNRFVGNPYWFEFGTKRGMKPTPFFRPAVVMARAQIAARLAEGMKDALLKK